MDTILDEDDAVGGRSLRRLADIIFPGVDGFRVGDGSKTIEVIVGSHGGSWIESVKDPSVE